MRFPVLAKLLAVGGVMALLGLVLARIGWLADERQGWRREAVASVQRSVAGAQTLLGPLVSRRCTEEWQTVVGEGKERRTEPARRDFTLRAAPDTLAVDATLQAEPRYRGLYKVNGYAGRLSFDAQWASLAALQPQREHAGSKLTCEAPQLYAAVSDPRGLRSAELRLLDTAAVGGIAGAPAAPSEPLRVEPGTGSPAQPSGLSASLAPWDDAAPAAPLAVRLTLELGGTDRLALVPAAGSTVWKLRSDWPHPSFGGRFLPAQREVTEAGFTASWRVSALASDASRAALLGAAMCSADTVAASGHGGSYDLPADVRSGPQPAAAASAGCLDTLAVALIDPVNPHVLSDRAIKYGFLFVALTFLCVGLVELLARRRVHPVQYALVGLALCLFFLLVLSLSEHVAFDIAYAVASVACIGVLAFYATPMLGSRRAGAAFAAGIAALYGLLYVLLQQEQAALAIGAGGLFAALAVVMWLTRRVDWYARIEALRTAAADARADADTAAPPVVGAAG